MTNPRDILVCPRCKSSFDWDVSSTDSGSFGQIRCRCHSYPVVAGVAVIQRNALVELAGELVAAGRYEDAIAVLLNRSRRRYPGREVFGRTASTVQSVPALIRWYLRACAAVEARSDVTIPETFTELLDEQISGHFAQYLRYRTVEESFWNLHALLPRIETRTEPVLDFGGGWGHSSEVIHATTDHQTVNVEIDFAPLYYQRQYFDGDIATVAIEPGSDIPFRDGVFGTVLDLDGFHYVPNKYSIASEYERVTRQDGQILLLHAHNRKCTEKGTPLNPTEYLDCFSWPGKLVPERMCLQSFLEADERFTLPEWSDERPQEVNVLLEQDGVSETPVRTHPHPLTEWDGPLVVNPLYEVSETAAGVELTRQSVSDQFSTEFKFSMDQIDLSYVITDKRTRRDLLFRGVLTPLPPSYSPGPPI